MACARWADWFRDKVGSGTAVLATVLNDKPLIVATVTDDLIKRSGPESR